ncbi:MAG TPA: DNA ligase [Acidobacteriota bacterium]|nr:DNA ligase [Acidobacteriota bacterium]
MMRPKLVRLRFLLTVWAFVAGFNSANFSNAANAPALLLANEFSSKFDPAKYLVSEKYDGVRAIWNGKTLRFRSGRTVNAPGWFVTRLPVQPLDGELWLARGRFEALSGIVRKVAPQDDEWRQIKYMIFELPEAPGTFDARARRIQEVVAMAQWAQLVAVEQFRVANRAALKRKLDEVVRDGGEGLVLHLADAAYVTGRSDVLLKLKPLQDAEAEVVGHVQGKGKYQGVLGALRVKSPEGKSFLIGTGFTDEARKNPPSVGTTVTYTYRGLTQTGLPRFASYLRVRDDF